MVIANILAPNDVFNNLGVYDEIFLNKFVLNLLAGNLRVIQENTVMAMKVEKTIIVLEWPIEYFADMLLYKSVLIQFDLNFECIY